MEVYPTPLPQPKFDTFKAKKARARARGTLRDTPHPYWRRRSAETARAP